MGVLCVHGAAVLDGDGAGHAGAVQLADDGADGLADLTGLLGSGGLAGADGPDGLIGDNHMAHLLGGHAGQGGLHLVGDEIHGHAQLPLLQALAHADDGVQPRLQGGMHLLVDGEIGLIVVLAALGVADHHILDAQLLQHLRGDLTGVGAVGLIVAVLRADGDAALFEQAHGGTLFLDEIGEISLSTQTKLLRVLQEREVRRIGDNKVISINVRIISATNKSINQLAGKELFRRDLMYRLDVLRIFLPPLRQRERDAELLFLHLMRQRGQENGIPVPEINISALSVLNDYPFNGNIRELRNIVERSLVICSGNTITRDDLLKALYPQDLEDTSPLPSYTASQTSSEESSILWALRECSGNQTKAARLLGINRSTLWRKMQKYNIKI